MSELISGKEALIALVNGEEVEYLENDNKWHLIDKETVVISALIDCKLRLKPRTVNLNGVEVPIVKYVAHSGGNCVKISCECPEDAAVISAALRSIFGKK